ncbi:hypothetical protein VIN01S_30950 [Vibrio inusitatus NBRC 102082]|uniref:Uncharacterized protein n=1 Tax=Vibrio inusitatus NBRC 102082 TaxID=1219070 RepID=A0A4Y3HZ41_9VIBR|nr:hypothetical protein [Vibrio inusitatus]GEA52291.1 hypothetical protein VIN01S_30950 [Vibrio inusitatus NBRC 102082]
MKLNTLIGILSLSFLPWTVASELNSDEMCQVYITELFRNVSQAEEVGMKALRLSLNKMADEHPEYLDIATQIAFGTALDDAGHLRVGQHINYGCTQDEAVLADIVYNALLKESIRLIEG